MEDWNYSSLCTLSWGHEENAKFPLAKYNIFYLQGKTLPATRKDDNKITENKYSEPGKFCLASHYDTTKLIWSKNAEFFDPPTGPIGQKMLLSVRLTNRNKNEHRELKQIKINPLMYLDKHQNKNWEGEEKDLFETIRRDISSRQEV